MRTPARSVRFSDPVRDALDIEAHQQGRSVSNLVQLAVRQYLERLGYDLSGKAQQ